MRNLNKKISDEKLQQYAENKKQVQEKKREKTQKLLSEGKEELLNMSFFTKILKTIGINYTELSEKSGFSAQLICYWIKADDCKLENIKKVFRSLGIAITPSFRAKTKQGILFDTENYNIESENISIFVKNGESKVLKMSAEKEGNLAFLAKFILENGFTLNQFCTIVELNYNLMYRWLEKDDIMISKLYHIAQKMQQRIVWKIEPMEEDQPNGN